MIGLPVLSNKVTDYMQKCSNLLVVVVRGKQDFYLHCGNIKELQSWPEILLF